MAINIDRKHTGPNGLPLLRLPRTQPQRAATTPEPPAAAPPTQPARLDPFEILRSAKPRKATKAEIEALAHNWAGR